MYTRFSPYVNIEFIDDLLCNVSNKKYLKEWRPLDIPIIGKKKGGAFYFNQGRSGLKWFLKCINKIKGKALRVGVQAFTCHVVVQSILESGNTPKFFDIDTNHFSTNHDQLDFENIDALIITHLFGIPNPDYERICESCKKRGIIIIDDLALTCDASIDGIQVGTLCDAYFYSFSFDKPISSFKGGMLFVNNHSLYINFYEEYYKLPSESLADSMLDLLKLKVYSGFFRKSKRPFGKSYSVPFEQYLFKQLVKNEKLYLKLIYHLWDCPHYIRKILSKISDLKSSDEIKILRLGTFKQIYLSKIWEQYCSNKFYLSSSVILAQQKIKQKFPDAIFPNLPLGSNCSWYRLPVLIPKSQKNELLRWGESIGVEIGCFNWHFLSFEPFKKILKIDTSLYPNSKRVVSEIVNVPMWSINIWK